MVGCRRFRRAALRNALRRLYLGVAGAVDDAAAKTAVRDAIGIPEPELQRQWQAWVRKQSGDDPPGVDRPHLLITNDYPPRPGGIQSYLQNLVDLLPPEQVVVYAPALARPVAPRLRRGGALHRRAPPDDIDAAYAAGGAEGCAAGARARDRERLVWRRRPLALLAPVVRRAGAHRVLASTHGHEVGWSMLPVARQVLRAIGGTTDTVTFVSKYTRGASHRPSVRTLRWVSAAGVDTERFVPDAAARAAIRERHGLGDKPVVLCLSRLVPRKGQDMLIRALPAIREQVPDAVLLVVGGGPYGSTLRELAAAIGDGENIVFTGSVPSEELAQYHSAADVFAMPSRTRGAAWMSRDSASSTWRPQPAGCPLSPETPAARRDGDRRAHRLGR